MNDKQLRLIVHSIALAYAESKLSQSGRSKLEDYIYKTYKELEENE